jgi:hypothetical protein
MELSDSQNASVASWIADGKSLADVQRLLREEFSISVTYMDVRFLVDDLGITFEEPEPETPADGDDATPIEAEVVDETGGVSIDVDAIMIPGALVSGSVTFSDGKRLKWQLSSAGQLGLVPGDDPDYRPIPEDVEQFQIQLQEVLQKKGY